MQIKRDRHKKQQRSGSFLQRDCYCFDFGENLLPWALLDDRSGLLLTAIRETSSLLMLPIACWLGGITVPLSLDIVLRNSTFQLRRQ